MLIFDTEENLTHRSSDFPNFGNAELRVKVTTPALQVGVAHPKPKKIRQTANNLLTGHLTLWAECSFHCLAPLRMCSPMARGVLGFGSALLAYTCGLQVWWALAPVSCHHAKNLGILTVCIFCVSRLVIAEVACQSCSLRIGISRHTCWMKTPHFPSMQILHFNPRHMRVKNNFFYVTPMCKNTKINLTTLCLSQVYLGKTRLRLHVLLDFIHTIPNNDCHSTILMGLFLAWDPICDLHALLRGHSVPLTYSSFETPYISICHGKEIVHGPT